MERLRAELLAAGIDAPEGIMLDGVSFNRCGKNNSSWCIGIVTPTGRIIANYGRWDEGWQRKYLSDSSTPLSDDEIRWQRELRELKKAEQEKIHQERAKFAADTIKGLKEVSTHAYLEKKSIKPYGAFIKGEDIIVPAYGVGGLTTFESISPDGSKKFLWGGRKKGSCFPIQGAETCICICEGYATGCSIAEATGYKTLVAFDAGNMINVARIAKQRFKNSRIIICADNDQSKKVNTGVVVAKKIAKELGCDLRYPIGQVGQSYDFNDLHIERGLDEVKRVVGNGRPGRTLTSIFDFTLKPSQWLIKNILPKDSLICITAPSGVGKTFLALDQALCITSGKDWFGNKVSKSGDVWLFLGEGVNGFRKRAEAWAIHNEIDLRYQKLRVSSSVAELSDAETHHELFEDIDSFMSMYGPPALIVFDTWARNLGSGDENASRDTGVAIKAIDEIRGRCRGSSIMIIHHTGHKAQDRGRGSSSLPAALDTEYVLEQDPDGLVKCHCRKMKDDDPPADFFFRLKKVGLNMVDEEGEEVTSCVCLQRFPEGLEVKRKKWHQAAYDALVELSGVDNVTNDVWREKFMEMNGGDIPRARFQEGKNLCIESEEVFERNGVFSIVLFRI